VGSRRQGGSPEVSPAPPQDMACRIVSIYTADRMGNKVSTHYMQALWGGESIL
jgi:hypothetical protein